MRAKQKMRITYGLMEKQFASYVKNAMSKRETGEGAATPALKLYRTLESRLDNVVYRAGFANTRALARQMVSHGHILVNGRRITVGSHLVREGDKVSIREGSKNLKVFANVADKVMAMAPTHVMAVDPKTLIAEIKSAPREVEPVFDIQKVLEYYSR